MDPGPPRPLAAAAGAAVGDLPDGRHAQRPSTRHALPHRSAAHAAASGRARRARTGARGRTTSRRARSRCRTAGRRARTRRRAGSRRATGAAGTRRRRAGAAARARAAAAVHRAANLHQVVHVPAAGSRCPGSAGTWCRWPIRRPSNRFHPRRRRAALPLVPRSRCPRRSCSRSWTRPAGLAAGVDEPEPPPIRALVSMNCPPPPPLGRLVPGGRAAAAAAGRARRRARRAGPTRGAARLQTPGHRDLPA